MKEHTPLKPMPIWESVLIFFVFTAPGIFDFYIMRPWLEEFGVKVSKAYLFSISLAFILMLIWALVGYAREKGPSKLVGFQSPFSPG